LSESLAYEIELYGISIILIEPGVINTNFAKNIIIPSNTQSISSYLLSSSSPSPSASLSTKYANVVERFLSHYYPAMRNASKPKEVAKVILESIEASVVSARKGDSNFHRYAVGDDAKLYADAKRKMNDSELHSFVAKRILS
jgi:short-subunit dehydrogenase